MYAHKGARTLSFGTAIEYNPEAHPNEERDRIVDAVEEQMREMARREEQLLQNKRK